MQAAKQQSDEIGQQPTGFLLQGVVRANCTYLLGLPKAEGLPHGAIWLSLDRQTLFWLQATIGGAASYPIRSWLVPEGQPSWTILIVLDFGAWAFRWSHRRLTILGMIGDYGYSTSFDPFRHPDDDR